MITNYVINCGYKHNTFKNEIFLLDKNIQLRYQAEGLNVSVYSTTDNIDRIYFNEIEYSQNENDYGKYRFENNLTIIFYENPNISFYDIIKKIAIKDYYLILKDYKNNYFLVNADNGYDLTYKISISDNSEEINTLTIEIKSVSNHPLMIFNDFKFNIINFSEKPCDYIDNSISSIKWSLANNIFFDYEVGFSIIDLSKLYNIDYLADSFVFEEELDDDGSIITNIKLNIPLSNNQFSFSYNLLEYTDNRYKMFFITKNGNLYFTSGKLSVRYDIVSNADSEINYVTLTFSSTNNMLNYGTINNGENGNEIWIASDETKCNGVDLYRVAYKYKIINDVLIKTEEYKLMNIVEENSCQCGYFEFGDWYESEDEYICGSQIGDLYTPTTKYKKWYRDKICGGEIVGIKSDYQWREYDINSCECNYYDSYTDWEITNEIKCGSELGEGYDSNSLYIKKIRYGVCDGEINQGLIFEQWYKIDGITCDDCLNPSISEWIAIDEFICGFELDENFIQDAQYQKYQRVILCDNVPSNIVVEEKWEIYEEISLECKEKMSFGYFLYSQNSKIPSNLINKNYINNIALIKNKQTYGEWKTYLPGETGYIQESDTKITMYDLTSARDMFYGYSGTGQIGTNNLLEVVTWDIKTSNVTDMYRMFMNCESLTSVNLRGMDTSNVTTMAAMFERCNSLTFVDLSSFDTSNVTTMDSMFWGCAFKTLDLSNFNTSKVTDVGFMFYQCYNLTSLNLSGWDLRNVNRHINMFEECDNLTSLNLSNVIIGDAFQMPKAITNVNLTNSNTLYSTSLTGLFSQCQNLASVNVSSFNTSNVTDMTQMFYYCNSLNYLDLSNFNTSKVTSMRDMFYQCSVLNTLDLSSFDTPNLIDVSQMFFNCSSLTSVDLSNFDTSKVTERNRMLSMFYGCNKLTHIKCKQAFKDWCWENQGEISLPTEMYDGGSGTWQIVG